MLIPEPRLGLKNANIPLPTPREKVGPSLGIVYKQCSKKLTKGVIRALSRLSFTVNKLVHLIVLRNFAPKAVNTFGHVLFLFNF